MYFFNVEAYYKDLDNLIAFSRRFNVRASYVDRFVDDGIAKGVEFLAYKKKGSLRGWIGYTLSRVNHQFPAFNNEESFTANHDRRHEVNVVAKYTLGVWTFVATWIFALV